MSILVANTGSSSLKLRMVGPAEEIVASCDRPAPDDPVDLEPIRAFLRTAPCVEAVATTKERGGPAYELNPLLCEQSK